VEVPRILAEPIPSTSKVKLDPSALPKGARAFYPAFIGDSFLVSIPPKRIKRLSAEQAFKEVIVPILKAIGFERSLKEFRVTASLGTKLPSANLSALSDQTCQEVEKEELKRYQTVCNAMRGIIRPTNDVERVIQDGDGMTFAQFKADIERRRIEYVFPQQLENIDIEHSGIIAGRWGETITSVHGTVFSRLVVTNKRVLGPNEAVKQAFINLKKVPGVADCGSNWPPRVELVLLSYGGASDADGTKVPGLRYAYRMLLFGTVPVPGGGEGETEPASWMAWVDAETGQILQLLPQFDEVFGRGETWRRDPGTPTQLSFFEVDPASGDRLGRRVDFFMDYAEAVRENEVTIFYL